MPQISTAGTTSFDKACPTELHLRRRSNDGVEVYDSDIGPKSTLGAAIISICNIYTTRERHSTYDWYQVEDEDGLVGRRSAPVVRCKGDRDVSTAVRWRRVAGEKLTTPTAYAG